MTEIRNLLRYDVVIIGGGTMGLSAAYHLKDTGKKVLLLDQFAIKNSLNSSQDFSRSFRVHYGDDRFLAQMAAEARKMWMSLQTQYAAELFFPVGKLLLSETDDSYAYECHDVMRELGLPSAIYAGKELQHRFPQFKAESCVLDASGGVLDAFKYLDLMLSEIQRSGVEIKEHATVEQIKGKYIRLENGDWIFADNILVDRLVRGCRNWWDMPVQVTRQQLLYLKPKKTHSSLPRVSSRFFSFMEQGFYGIPIHGIQAVKVSNHHPGPNVIADEVNREADMDFVERTRDWLSQYIPRLADAELKQAKVCLYTGTVDRNFVIDTLDETTTIATGFSGHGFKFSPLIGQILSDLVLHGVSRHGIEPWSLRRFDDAQYSTQSFANAL